MLSVRSAQDTKAASEFYEAKVGELGANIKDIEAIVQNKTNSLRVVEEGAYSRSFSRHVRGLVRVDADCFFAVSVAAKSPRLGSGRATGTGTGGMMWVWRRWGMLLAKH